MSKTVVRGQRQVEAAEVVALVVASVVTQLGAAGVHDQHGTGDASAGRDDAEGELEISFDG